jgi:polar amino acid transport system substrate-binding protein
MKKKANMFAILFLLMVVFIAGCGQSDSKSTNTPASTASAATTVALTDKSAEVKTVEAGVFHFAASGEYQPFSYFKDGQVVGFDIEIGNEIAKRLGLKPKVTTTPFAGIIAGVKEGRYDAAIASHVITEERKKAVDFAEPYYVSGGQLFVRPDSTLSKLEDLKGKEVAVALGTTHEKMAREYTQSVKTYDSDVTALRALEQGKHDVVITDSIVGEIAIQQGFKIKKSGAALSEVAHGIAVQKGNTALLTKVNEALKEMKADGTYLEISKKYFKRDISLKE